MSNTHVYTLLSYLITKDRDRSKSICLTCGVSFCIDVVILNLVLLLVKLIFSENVDSVSISSCEKRERILNLKHSWCLMEY